MEAKLGGILGQPTEAKSYVNRMAQNIDAISRQRKEVLTQEGEGLKTRLESIVKSDEGAGGGKRRAYWISFSGRAPWKLGGWIGTPRPAPRASRSRRTASPPPMEQREGHWVKVQ